ncbi:hypothetical protein [Flavobacterium sp.]|uniref:hypothetical protein n=1 Tax=Flavobacterium sp. TaxID=239 RepID=UPI002604F526|nr:hypothetical protein [Flavobacterium sp.]
MKKYIVLFVFCLAFLNLKAQETSINVEKSQFKINVLSPGITYELGVSNTTTLSTNLNIGMGFSSNNDLGTKWLFSPYMREEYRYYYNLEKRNLKGKISNKNSGNFIALSGSYYLKPINNSDFVSAYDGFTIAPTWGLQRTYRSGINISFITGIGYNFGTENNKSSFVPVVNFTLGWVIGK